MKYTWILTLVVMFLLSVVGPSGAGDDSAWTFVVMGDTRDKIIDTRTGISPDLAKIAEAVAKEKPDLVIHTGDLCNGYYTSKDSPMNGKFREMFQNWKAAMKPVYDYENRKGIPVYLVRGNHEDGKIVTDRNLKKAYEEEFAHLMPQGGPEHEKGLTYSFIHRNAAFLALDEYYEKKDIVVRGYINQKWLDGELAEKKKPFMFVFSHTPAFRVGSYHQSPFPDFYSHPKQRDTMWASFRKAGVMAFLCGHIHFYCRGTIDGIEQVVVGNGGADMVSYNPKEVDPRLTIHYPTGPVDAAGMEVGYLVMRVDEAAGKVHGTQKLLNTKTGKWETGDTFTLQRIGSP